MSIDDGRRHQRRSQTGVTTPSQFRTGESRQDRMQTWTQDGREWFRGREHIRLQGH